MHINHLFRRKGGGGGGAKGGGSSGGKSSGGSSSTGAGSSGAKVPVSGSVAGGKSSATAYGAGGGKIVTIPAGQPFAGRSAGGGTRQQVFGNSFYGSGYPGVASRGVSGLGLPFFFWPVVFTGGIGTAAYLHDSDEYGRPDNTSRPGGPLAQAQFQSNSTSSTFHVVADNTTIASLIASITANCSADFTTANSSWAPLPFNSSDTDPQPEQAVQFYRASSVMLSLDGYNDTSALSNDTNAAPASLPSGVDMTLLTCLNDTIGQSVPLVDAGMRLGANQAGSTLAVAAVLAYLLF